MKHAEYLTRFGWKELDRRKAKTGRVWAIVWKHTARGFELVQRQAVEVQRRMNKTVYCARFEGLIPEPHQLQLKVPSAVVVEVFREGYTWRARERSMGRHFPGDFASPEDCQAYIETRFEKKVDDWRVYDEHGTLIDPKAAAAAPPLSGKAVATPRDNYGWKSGGSRRARG